MPPAASTISRRHIMLLPWAKPAPTASAQNCQRAWKEFRKVHSRRASTPCGMTPSGGEQTRPTVGREADQHLLEIVFRGQHIGIGEHDELVSAPPASP